MDLEENALEKQVGLWTLLGPFIMLVTMAVLLISPVRYPSYLAFIGLIAIPCCWHWQMRGLIISLLGIFTAFILQVLNTPHAYIFWDILLTSALMLTLTITAFCSLEVKDLFASLHKESTSRLQEFLGANEKMQLLEEQKEKEIALATGKAEQLQLKINDQNILLKSYERRVDEMNEKISSISLQNDTLLRELFQKRHECEKLSQQLQTLEATIATLRIEQQQTELCLKEQADQAARKQSELELYVEELAQCQLKSQEFMAASDKKEALLTDQLKTLEEKLAQAAAYEASWQGLEQRYREQVGALETQLSSLAEQKASQVEKKQEKSNSKSKKSSKPSKTNDWANAILSRWSESHDPAP